MNLPLSARLFSLVLAVCIAFSFVTVVAEIGHPPADGVGLVASLLLQTERTVEPPVLSVAGQSVAP